MAAVTLLDIRTALSGLLGESSVPTDTSRDTQINYVIRDIYYRAHWSWRRKTSNVAFNSSGVSTTDLSSFLAADSYPLPSQDLNAPQGEAKVVTSGDNNDTYYRLIDKEDAEFYASGDRVIWYDGNEVDGYTFNIKETDSPTLQITYFRKHDVLSSSADTTYIPLTSPIAAGAYAFYVKNRDNARDNREEKAEFEREVSKLRNLENSTKSNRLISKTEKTGSYLGRV